MSYTTLYRKFRPAVFDDVKGQEHIVTTLKNQIHSDRIGHAYLFCGTRGTGKTTVARIFARAVNCESPVDGSPCGQCEMCKQTALAGSQNIIEIDAASNSGIDNMRRLREEVAYRPTQGRYKVYIIDEAHMLSTGSTTGAFNALLKTLEEPPEYVIFILATTEAAKIPATIKSRCQRYDFHRMSVDTVSGRIRELLNKEKIEADDEAVRYIARRADGSMRDALSLLEQCISCYMGEKLTYDNVLSVLGSADAQQLYEMLQCIISSDVKGCMYALDAFARQGREISEFVSDFTWYLRNLLLVKNADGLEDILDMSTENIAALKETGKNLDNDIIMRYIKIFSELSMSLRQASQKRVLAETALIRMCKPQMQSDTASLLQRLSDIEAKIESGELVRSAAPRPEREGEEREEVHAEKKPKAAAPEELVVICAQWDEIVSGFPNKMARTYLAGKKPKYNGATGESKLYITLDDEMAMMYFRNSDAGEALMKAIEKATNRAVQIEFVMDKNAGDDLAVVPIDERVREVVNMPVEIEKTGG